MAGQNIVLGLTTVHTPDTILTLPRKRPAETSTNAHIVRPVFGDEVIKKLGIPKFTVLWSRTFKEGGNPIVSLIYRRICLSIMYQRPS